MELLKQELFALNPYAGLKELSNKEFGENWSENWIVQHCPSLLRNNGRGHDLFSEHLGRIEVKSTRLPCKQITFNQIHPYDCDNFLFVLYNTEDGTEEIFLVPAATLVAEFSLSVQHQRVDSGEKANCFTMGMTKKNKAILEKYRIASWEELNGKA
jgi:hypothetical protein